MASRQRQILGGAAALFLFIAISLPHATAEDKSHPTANQNLNPTQAWRSSEYCLQNVSAPCQTGPKNYTLTSSGWLNVSSAYGPKFCDGGCANHTRAVLRCLENVKRDYWFANKATVQDLYDTIDNGCQKGFTGVSKYGSHSSN